MPLCNDAHFELKGKFFKKYLNTKMKSLFFLTAQELKLFG